MIKLSRTGLTTVALLVLLSVATLSCSQPSSMECIAGVHLALEDTSSETRTAIFNSFAGGKENARGLAGIAVRDNDVYFQFRDYCEGKDAAVREIMSRMKLENTAFPSFSEIPGPIKPSPETIDIRGESI